MAAVKRIGELLVEKGYITERQLREGLEVQARAGEKRRLGEILISRGYVSRAHVQVALAKQRAAGKD